MVRQWLTKLSGFSRGVCIKHHVEHPSHHQKAKKIGLIRQMAQDRKDEYVNEAFGELSVIEGTNAWDETQNRSKTRTSRTRRCSVDRYWSIRGSWRNSALKPGGEAVLAINHAADIALAILAECLSASAAVRSCRLISVNSASHACKLLADS
jgi:hypothetical protein